MILKIRRTGPVDTPATPDSLKIIQNVSFEFSIFVQFEWTSLVALFDRKLQVFEKLANEPFWAFSMNFCPLKM